MRILDDLETELSIFIDGKIIACKNVGKAVFVVNEINAYEYFINRSLEDEDAGTNLRLLTKATYSRILSTEERKQVTRAFIKNTKGASSLLLSKGGFIHSPAGTLQGKPYGNYEPKEISIIRNYANPLGI